MRATRPIPAGMPHGRTRYQYGCHCDVCTAENTTRKHAYTLGMPLAGRDEHVALAHVPFPDGWQTQGACRAEDTALFFAADRGDPATLHAKEVCGRCPVVGACLAYAMAHPALWGMWAGTTRGDRQRLRRRLSAVNRLAQHDDEETR